MGNCRFRLSDMMPNSWFYKLRDMSRPGNQHKTTNPIRKKHTSSSPSSSLGENNYPSIITRQPHPLDQRKSYHLTRDFPLHPNSPSKIGISHPGFPPESPRRSSRRRTTKRNRPPKRQSSIHAGCSCRAALESVWTKFPDSATEECPNSSLLRDDQTSPSEHDPILPEPASDRGETPNTFDGMVSLSTSCKCKAGNDIAINVDDNKPFAGGFDRASGVDRLPPIITKKREPTKIRGTSAGFPEKDANGSLPVKVVKDDFTRSRAWSGKALRKTPATPVVRRYSANSSMPGVKLRVNSPRIGNRRIQGRRSCPSNSSAASRRRMSESFAVVKSSKDPRRDFRKSMMEMIVENNIRTSKDLEELLACYLSLNSDEYHELIINVFKQIWFDFIIHLRLK